MTFNKLKKIIIIFLGIFHASLSLCGQDTTLQKSVYKVNYRKDIPIAVGAIIANTIGLQIVNSKTNLDTAVVLNLKPSDVPWFDRPAVFENNKDAKSYKNTSDMFMNITFALPAVLALDKKIREDWRKILVIYLQTEFLTGNLYSWGAGMHINRIRPLVYWETTPLSEKLGDRTRTSFYSGHVATVAAATFFTVKVYSDYHPENVRYMPALYGAALVPPVFMGYLRYKAGKHFLSDNVTGLLVGATMGIVVPQLHKITPSVKGLSLNPVLGNYRGLTLNYKF